MDLLEAADRVSRSYWDGSDRSKINLQEAMRELRIQVDLENKRRAQSETTTLARKP